MLERELPPQRPQVLFLESQLFHPVPDLDELEVLPTVKEAHEHEHSTRDKSRPQLAAPPVVRLPNEMVVPDRLREDESIGRHLGFKPLEGAREAWRSEHVGSRGARRPPASEASG